jgi:hypothetical protein
VFPDNGSVIRQLQYSQTMAMGSDNCSVTRQ